MLLPMHVNLRAVGHVALYTFFLTCACLWVLSDAVRSTGVVVYEGSLCSCIYSWSTVYQEPFCSGVHTYNYKGLLHLTRSVCRLSGCQWNGLLKVYCAVLFTCCLLL
jgi:hypothetical protein